MKIYKAPSPVPIDSTYKVFLAGSIEMGKAIDWQSDITRRLADIENVSVLNPRRDDWDSSWVQSIDDPQFSEQVNWELDGMNRSDLIVMYFAPDTKSPITLLELGLHVKEDDKGLIVCCPDGFWRKGNIEIVCDRYKVEVLNDYKNFLIRVRDHVHANAIDKDNRMKRLAGISIDK